MAESKTSMRFRDSRAETTLGYAPNVTGLPEREIGRVPKHVLKHIVEDPEIRGGIPTVKGTRIGVYEAAGLLQAEGMAEALQTLPSMTRERFEAAKSYAAFVPMPPRTKSNYPNARQLSKERVSISTSGCKK